MLGKEEEIVPGDESHARYRRNAQGSVDAAQGTLLYCRPFANKKDLIRLLTRSCNMFPTRKKTSAGIFPGKKICNSLLSLFLPHSPTMFLHPKCLGVTFALRARTHARARVKERQHVFRMCPYYNDIEK